MRRILYFIVVPAAVLVSLISLAEFGLRLRSGFFDVPTPVLSEKKGLRVLYIGDSIFGFVGAPYSVGGKLATRLRGIDPEVQFAEVSGPGKTTSEVLAALPSVLKNFQPQITVMMVGKSDFHIEESVIGRWFQKLRISKFIRMTVQDLNQRQHEIRELPQKSSHDIAFDPAWDLYRLEKYSEAIPVFEKALSEHPHYEVGIKGLNHCYLAAKEYARGEVFFDRLTEKSNEKSLLRILAPTLRMIALDGDPEARQTQIAKIEVAIEESSDRRAALRAKLWLERANRDAEGFGRTFAGMHGPESRPYNSKTVRNLREILDALLQASSMVIVLQYPVDHSEGLRSDISDYLDRIQFFETREWLVGKNPNDAIRFIDGDMEHLTGDGSEVVAGKIAEVCSNFKAGAK